MNKLLLKTKLNSLVECKNNMSSLIDEISYLLQNEEIPKNEKPVSDYQFCSTALNAFARYNIKTIQDVLDTGKRHLAKMHLIGEKTIRNISEVLLGIGYELPEHEKGWIHDEIKDHKANINRILR